MRLAERIKILLDLVKIGAVVAAFLLPMLSVFALGFWALWGRTLIEIAREEIGINEITAALRDLSGESGVLQSRAGFSYVLEPVRRGETLTAVFHLRRTELGAGCQALGATPIFTGPRNIPLPGVLLSPVQQIGREFRPVEILISVPRSLAPGRIGLFVTVEYDCGGPQSIFDQTDPVFFQLDS